MPKGIRTHVLDFDLLETHNPRTLVFVDSSEYFEQPEKPLLDVTLPGQNKYLSVSIEASHVNVFNSNTLGLTQVLDTCYLIDLPDGVYTLKFKICPYKFINRTKFFLRTAKLSNKLNQVLDTADFEDLKVKNEIIEILLLIESGKASAELANVEKASEKYRMANDKVDKLLENLKTK